MADVWNLHDVDAPDGVLSPVVLLSREGAARAVVLTLEPGQEMGDHEVKEHAFLLVVDGTAQLRLDGGEFDAPAGTFAHFEPGERHAVRAAGGARLLLLLAPWPAAHHYVGA